MVILFLRLVKSCASEKDKKNVEIQKRVSIIENTGRDLWANQIAVVDIWISFWDA